MIRHTPELTIAPVLIYAQGLFVLEGACMKPYISIDKQIALLENRKIIIHNYKFAHHVLEYENYYCVINGYKSPFITSTNPDVYKMGTLFSEIVALYTFDRRLREIIFPDLLRIEHVIKSHIINIFSANHGNDHTSYLRPEAFNSEKFVNFKRVNSLIFDLIKLIDKESEKHEAIAHYYNTYGFVPLWVLAKVMTFGKINSFYGLMLMDEKTQIAMKFNLDPKTLKSLIDYLAKFRNKCAHGERIYSSSKDNFKPRPIPELPLHQKLSIPHNRKGYKYGTTDILALLIAMKPFMQSARFSHLISRIDFTLNKKLKRRINKQSFNYVINTMGLADDWIKLKDL